MTAKNTQPKIQVSPTPSIFTLLKPYKGLIILLVLLALLSNGLTLVVPQFISRGIDGFTKGNGISQIIEIEFLLAGLFIFIFTYLQSIVQTYASERVARDLRTQLASKISRQSNAYIQSISPAKLLTNLTSDIDSVKTFVSQAIVSIVSSVLLIVGSSVLLLLINWKLALAVLTIVPIIGGTFFIVLSKVRVLFTKSREVIDWLNKVINESILGSALIRVLNSQQPEYEKFLAANTDAKNLGMQILRLFAGMIPIITFVASMATLIILALGGKFVIGGTMTLGNFAAFNSYIFILIFPIFVIGFMSNIIAQATASYQRVGQVLNATEEPRLGTLTNTLHGDIELKNITVSYGEKQALKNISFSIAAATKTAVIGPTAAGKTQLLYLLTALMKPNSGNIFFDGKDIESYDTAALHQQIGFVFQDSIIFNMSIRENIAFSQTVTPEAMEKAIATAELTDFIDSLPEKLDTIVSERGNSLSGGQKQRIMLARALALNPRILLLDDFTARVDNQTERNILGNVQKNYPGITLVSVTQKIAAVEHYDKIILLMEGEALAQGTHQELMQTSPEYVQIYNSQRSTSHYELQPQ
jgi:ATP-binding cassette subfamily B protein